LEHDEIWTRPRECNLSKSGANLTNMSGLVWNACHVCMEHAMPGMEYGVWNMACLVWSMEHLIACGVLVSHTH